MMSVDKIPAMVEEGRRKKLGALHSDWSGSVGHG